MQPWRTDFFQKLLKGSVYMSNGFIKSKIRFNDYKNTIKKTDSASGM